MYIMTCDDDEQCSKSIVQRKIQKGAKQTRNSKKNLEVGSGAMEE